MAAAPRLLLTAGPTREPIDPVRFLSNRSTGRMGFAIAQEALARRWEVDLVLGPVEGSPPAGVGVTRIETAQQMLAASLALLPRASAIVCAAAVSDFRVAAPATLKLKRRHGSPTLELVENPDIAAALGAVRGERPMAIFALETEAGGDEARRKLHAKRATLCVLNSPEALGAQEARYKILLPPDRWVDLGTLSKPDLARRLLAELLPDPA